MKKPGMPGFCLSNRPLVRLQGFWRRDRDRLGGVDVALDLLEQ